MRTEPSTPFSNGMEYENFIYYFCERCKKGKRDEDGFPESPEEGGCPIWDAIDNGGFDAVPVVRCRECEYAKNAKVNKKGYRICPASHMEIVDDDYCSYGERRTDNERR